MWLILKDRLNALDILAHKGIGQGGMCVLYGVESVFKSDNA